MSNVGVAGIVREPAPDWDYKFFVYKGQRFYVDRDGVRKTTDDLNPLLDLLADNSYELSVLIDAGEWPYDAPMLLEGAGSSWSRFPIIRGRGIGRSILQPLGASVHGIHLTKAVTPDLRDFTLSLDPDQIQYHGIYAQDDPSQAGYPELGTYHGKIDNIKITGGKNHTSTPTDYWGMCIETSEFYQLSNIVMNALAYRKNGISLRQVDGTLSYAYHDSVISGKNRINVQGEAVTGLEVANIASNKEVNLLKGTGALWIRLASGAGVGVHLKNFQRGFIHNIHTEDFPTAVHVETNCYNIELGGGEGYSYVDSGGTFFDIDSGQDIRLKNWCIAAYAAQTLINNAAGTANAPVQLEATVQGTVQPTITNTGFLKINRHNTMATVYPWFSR